MSELTIEQSKQMDAEYDHSGCGGDDACHNCGHSDIVFHAGGGCFHVNQSHERAAMYPIEGLDYTIKTFSSGLKIQQQQSLDFCKCDGVTKKESQ